MAAGLAFSLANVKGLVQYGVDMIGRLFDDMFALFQKNNSNSTGHLSSIFSDLI